MSLLMRAIVAAADGGEAADLGLVAVAGTVLTALASPWENENRSEAELLHHHRVVQAVFERVPCLPARFGRVFTDEHTLRARLVEQEADLASRLARLGHRCELAITCAWRDLGGAAPIAMMPAASSGRAYLERGVARARTQKERQRRADEIVARLLGELAVEPAFIRHRTCPRPAVAVSMSALVTRDEIDEINSRLERLGAQLPDVTTVVQGPWAPYTFAVSE